MPTKWFCSTGKLLCGLLLHAETNSTDAWVVQASCMQQAISCFVSQLGLSMRGPMPLRVRCMPSNIHTLLPFGGQASIASAGMSRPLALRMHLHACNGFTPIRMDACNSHSCLPRVILVNRLVGPRGAEGEPVAGTSCCSSGRLFFSPGAMGTRKSGQGVHGRFCLNSFYHCSPASASTAEGCSPLLQVHVDNLMCTCN